jgi:hypothetical protein
MIGRCMMMCRDCEKCAECVHKNVAILFDKIICCFITKKVLTSVHNKSFLIFQILGNDQHL